MLLASTRLALSCADADQVFAVTPPQAKQAGNLTRLCTAWPDDEDQRRERRRAAGLGEAPAEALLPGARAQQPAQRLALPDRSQEELEQQRSHFPAKLLPSDICLICVLLFLQVSCLDLISYMR